MRLQRYPELIFVPKDADEIARIFLEAKKEGKQVAARGGGHSYASYGLGGTDDCWIIDLQQLSKVDIHGTFAYIGAGNRLGRVALKLDDAGKAIPHGLCPRVGISGHALHGGFGFASRNWGLALDSIDEIQVVLPNGRTTWVSRDTEPELFWAALGAGSSFCIATEFRVKLHDRPEHCIHYWYSWASKGTLPSKDTLIKVHKGFQDFCHQRTVPKELAVRMRTLKNYMEITGAFWGTREEFNTAIQPLLDLWEQAKVPPDQVRIRHQDEKSAPVHASVHERTWREMLLYMANDDHLESTERTAMSFLDPEDYKLFFLDGLLEEEMRKLNLSSSSANQAGSSSCPDITKADRLQEIQDGIQNEIANAPDEDAKALANARGEFVFEFQKSLGQPQSSPKSGFSPQSRSLREKDTEFPELVRGSKSSLTDEFLATSLCIKDKIDSNDLFTYITEHPVPYGYNWFLLKDFYGGENSMIRQGANRDHSCYSYRDYMFTFQFYINIDKSINPKERKPWEEAIKFLHDMRDTVKKNTDEDFKVYMCYIDPEDSTYVKDEETGEQTLVKPLPASYYYGTEQYQRLKELKKRYDPDNRLWNPQSIGAEDLKK